MRRSAAPSLQSSAKRFRFMSPFMNSSSEIKENELLEELDPEIAENFKQLPSIEPEYEHDVPLVCGQDSERSNVRSTSEIMQLILGASEDYREEVPKKFISSTRLADRERIKVPKNSEPLVSQEEDLSQKMNCSSTTSESSISKYNVLWCKRSGKKHKIWEGDGILIVKNRSAILKNSEGKEIDRGMGYKFKDVSALEEGSKFYVGGKECEIQSLISSEIYLEEKQLEAEVTSSKASQPSSLKSTKRGKLCT